MATRYSVIERVDDGMMNGMVGYVDGGGRFVRALKRLSKG